MSGHDVPYQLRKNKFIERQLFLDLLDFVRVWNGPSLYVYASMGGRFLEDFKVVNDRFAIEHMISIEIDATTCKRQQFNRLGFIECRNQVSSEFIDDFDKLQAIHPGKRFIVWLDYAVANKRGDQLGEFRRLVSKMASGDVAKITLNANPQSYRRRAGPLIKKDFDAYLKDPNSDTHKDFDTFVASIIATAPAENNNGSDRVVALTDVEYDAICIENVKQQLGEYIPSGGVSADHLGTKEFASFLAEAVKIAGLKAVAGSKLQILPLGAFRYRDGEHQMLTVTAIIADDALAGKIAGDPIFENWPFRTPNWSDSVHEISVPDLSAKERHAIDGLISDEHDDQKIHGELPFRFDERDEHSLALLSAYVRHYRRYPTFMRIQ